MNSRISRKIDTSTDKRNPLQDRSSHSKTKKIKKTHPRQLPIATFEAAWMTEKGKIVATNRALSKLLGYEPKEIIGFLLENLTLPEYRDRIKENIQTGYENPYEIVLFKKDRSQIVVEMVGKIVGEKKKQQRIAILRNITERKRIEEALIENEASIRSLYEITSTQQLSFESKIQALLATGRQRFSLDIGILSRIEGSCYEVIEAQSQTYPIAKGDVWELSRTYCESTLKSSEPIGFEYASISEWKNHPCYLERLIEAYIGAKVVANNQVYGTLSFSNLSPRKAPLNPADREFLKLMAQWIGSEMERRQIQDELAKARDTALESARLKSEFMANMSHEIRTPMNAIIGMTDILLDSELTSRQQELIETVHGSGIALLEIINDILDFSKIEAGKMKLDALDFDLREMIEGITELLAARAQAKNLELISYVAYDLPTALRGDEGRLRQVLMNLASNAIKFTEQGEIIIRAIKEEETKTHASLRLEVSDTGIGIPLQAQKQLFQAFTQVDNSTTRKYSGTGLGLTISKKLIEMMDGKIGLESIPGKGSTFWCKVIFAKSFPFDKASEQIPSPNLYRQKVLIVEPNATQREILKNQLLSWGMLAESAATSTQALALIKEEIRKSTPYQLILLDAKDFDLVQKAELDFKLSKITVVAMFPLTQPIQPEKLQAMGIEKSLIKPIKRSALHHCLTGISEGSQPTKPESQYQALAQHSQQRRYFRILVVEDNSVNQKVILFQLQKLGYRADAVGNGAEALKALAHIAYNLVFMDCQMPQMDGYAATQEIRRQEKENSKEEHTPIIAMTAHALEGDREKCLAAGMDDYISKPVRLEQLAGLMAKWDIPIDTAMLSGISDLAQKDGQDTFNDLIDTFLRDAEIRLTHLIKAAGQKDNRSLQAIAHSLKGSCGSLGAKGMYQLCKNIEQDAKDGKLEEVPELLEALEDEFQRVGPALEEIKKGLR